MSVQHIPTYVNTIRSLGKHIPKSSNLLIVFLGRICFCAAASLTEARQDTRTSVLDPR